MKETIKVLITLVFVNFLILGCIDIDGANTNTSIEGECSLDTDYINTYEPERLSATDFDAPTIVLVHGKNASPTDTHMLNLAEDFRFDGYNVVMPYMSWFGTQWNSTYCESISYLNYILVTESARTTQDIILTGYDLGGTMALAYVAMSNTVKPSTLNVIAPSHFIHQSSVLADAHAESIALAKYMVENNDSQTETIFQTYNDTSLISGTTIGITTTPEIYLSFHDVDEFPNIESTTPLIRVPMLWLAGDTDPLTDFAVSVGIIDLIPSTEKYEVLTGDHTTVLDRASDAFNIWFDSL